VTEQRVQKRLAVILAADVGGYSALLQRAEEATYAEFERLKRELIAPSLSRNVLKTWRDTSRDCGKPGFPNDISPASVPRSEWTVSGGQCHRREFSRYLRATNARHPTRRQRPPRH
jgi:hypothetical protein